MEILSIEEYKKIEKLIAGYIIYNKSNKSRRLRRRKSVRSKRSRKLRRRIPTEQKNKLLNN